MRSPTDRESKTVETLPRIPVAAPVLDGRESEYVAECLSTTWISSAGRFISEFERAFADFCDVRHAIATNNGTTALHLTLLGLGLQPGDEVIMPTLTYVATANCVKYCNAQPVFADNDPLTFNLDPEDVQQRISPRTKGIIVVHLYGQPVNMDPILEIADQNGLFVIEDAAEAVGARYKGRRVGGLANCASFSFFGNKIITTGEGGMVTTDDDALAARMRQYRGQGMDLTRRYWFPMIGYNYRMTNIAAAIGLAQLERADKHLAARRRVAAEYDQRLKSLSDRIILPKTEAWAEHVFWMYTIMLRNGGAAQRDALMQRLDAQGIETRPVFYPMHVMPPYEQNGSSFPHANLCAARGVNLPTHGALTKGDIERIAVALEQALS